MHVYDCMCVIVCALRGVWIRQALVDKRQMDLHSSDLFRMGKKKKKGQRESSKRLLFSSRMSAVTNKDLSFTHESSGWIQKVLPKRDQNHSSWCATYTNNYTLSHTQMPTRLQLYISKLQFRNSSLRFQILPISKKHKMQTDEETHWRWQSSLNNTPMQESKKTNKTAANHH